MKYEAEAVPFTSNLVEGEAVPTPTLPKTSTTNGVRSLNVPSSFIRRVLAPVPVPAVVTLRAVPMLLVVTCSKRRTSDVELQVPEENEHLSLIMTVEPVRFVVSSPPVLVAVLLIFKALPLIVNVLAAAGSLKEMVGSITKISPDIVPLPDGAK